MFKHPWISCTSIYPMVSVAQITYALHTYTEIPFQRFFYRVMSFKLRRYELFQHPWISCTSILRFQSPKWLMHCIRILHTRFCSSVFILHHFVSRLHVINLRIWAMSFKLRSWESNAELRRHTIQRYVAFCWSCLVRVLGFVPGPVRSVKWVDSREGCKRMFAPNIHL